VAPVELALQTGEEGNGLTRQHLLEAVLDRTRDGDALLKIERHLKLLSD